jgi:hypothetical protein
MKSVKVYLDNLEVLHDISFAISCTQDYRDAIDTTTADGIKEYDNVTDRISRLFTFYNQLVGFEQIRGLCTK